MMQKTSRHIFTEMIWLAVSFGVTCALLFLLFGKTILHNSTDIHIHDTYFIVPAMYVIPPLLLLVIFLVFFIRAYRIAFCLAFSNRILLISGVSLVITLTLLIKPLSQTFTASWTVYPPLSALGPNNFPELRQNPVPALITNCLTVIQLLILAMLLFAEYRWGRYKKINS